MNLVGFEPYDDGSHRAVRESISRHSRHRWRWLTRPGRAWKWRMRLAALELVQQARAMGVWEPPPDAFLATSLLAAADLRAALPADLRGRPLIVYMHENQGVYPMRQRGKGDVHLVLTNLASVVTADRVIWNSAWNRDSFTSAAVELLQAAPDARMGDWVARLAERSVVIWPPVEGPPVAVDLRRALHKPARIVWPHRWEHDKGPDALLDLADRLAETLDLRWTILGEQFSRQPAALQRFAKRHATRIDHMGYEPDRQRYWQHLLECDWVLSTARHEFFGIAVVEALLAGCLPWLPQRLSYPELLPEVARDLSPQHVALDAAAVREAVIRHLQPAVAGNAVGRLDDVIDETVKQSGC